MLIDVAAESLCVFGAAPTAVGVTEGCSAEQHGLQLVAPLRCSAVRRGGVLLTLLTACSFLQQQLQLSAAPTGT